MNKIIKCEDGITIKEFEFLSSNKYTEIHGKMWIPKRDVVAVLQISHGMAEHIERYDEFARFMAEKGILVVGNNHIGHGNSVNSKDELGYFSIPIKGMSKEKLERNNSSANVVKDLYHVTKIVKKHYPVVPYILLGHSMGSFMARRYLMEYGNAIDGVIIIGTGNHSKVAVEAGLTIIRTVSGLKGERYRSKMVDKIVFGTYNKRIANPETEYEWMSSNREVVKKYLADELCGYKFTMNGMEALLSTVKYIINPENIKKIPQDVKMLIASGTEDPVGNYGEAVKDVYETYKGQGVKDITLNMYEGFRHEILNEVNNKKVYEDIFQWINEHVIH